VDVFKYATVPIVEATDAGLAANAASTPELAHLHYELNEERRRREELEETMKRMRKVVETMEVNMDTLATGLSHITDKHLAPLERAIRGATTALLPIIFSCGAGPSEDGTFSQFEGVVRPANPSPPKSPINVPSVSRARSVSSSSNDSIPSLIPNSSPSSVSVLSTGAESFWLEMAEFGVARPISLAEEVSGCEGAEGRTITIVDATSFEEGEGSSGSDGVSGPLHPTRSLV